MKSDLCIVGGGTAGYVAALVLKTKYPHLNINLIKSDKIGIIGVGEGSTPHWDTFIKTVGITADEIIIDELIKKIKEVIPPDFIYSIHKTSIYAIFEKSPVI